MRIGIVTTWFERGAAYVSRAYKQALDTRHEVFIYARGGEEYARGNPDWDGDEVTWAPASERDPSYLHVDWRHFQKWLASRKIDAVIFNEQQDWRIIIQCAKRLTIPFGAYVDYYMTETWRFFWLYDFLLCNTKRHWGLFHEHPQCLYIPWGTQPELFTPNEELVTSGVVTFFHSAGYGKGGLRKGTDLAIKAFSRLTSDCRLVLHSQVSKDNYPDLQKELSDPRVTFVHDTVPLPGLYHLGDVYLYPSRLDGIGLSLTEALAAGLPAITTNSPPMNEFVSTPLIGRTVQVGSYPRRKDGYYWPEAECDMDDLICQMQWFVDHPDQIPGMKRHAREYAKRNLDWQTNSACLVETVDTLQQVPKSLHLIWQASLFERWRQRFKRPGRFRVVGARLSRMGDALRYYWPW